MFKPLRGAPRTIPFLLVSDREDKDIRSTRSYDRSLEVDELVRHFSTLHNGLVFLNSVYILQCNVHCKIVSVPRHEL